MRKHILNSVLLSTFLCRALATSGIFRPGAYSQSDVKCKALNRKEGIEKDITIQYVNINPSGKDTLLMVHGWPGLWSNWGNQIVEFQDEYHIIAPNHRGFGSSTHPGDVESSGTMGDLVGDLICVLDDTGVTKAICLGHDWGAQVCWEAARMRPDRISAVAAAVVPYLSSAGPFIPTAALVYGFPRLSYQLFFQKKTGDAIIELDKDIRRTLRATYRSVEEPPPVEFLTSATSFLHAYDEISEIPRIPFMSVEEEDYLVDQFSIQGFGNTLYFYTEGARRLGWEFSHKQGNFTIPQQSLSIFPTNDPVADWEQAARYMGSNKLVPNLSVETLPTAHWIMLEKPIEFNVILRQWLGKVHIGDKDTTRGQTHFIDEL